MGGGVGLAAEKGDELDAMSEKCTTTIWDFAGDEGKL